MSTTITSLQYADASNTNINMSVTRDGETFPFTYSPGDNEPVSLDVAALLYEGSYEIAAFVPPPPPVPSTVTRKQMLIGLKRAEFITAQEAIDAGFGAVPADIQSVFATLPTQAAKDEAAIEWANMLYCERIHPIVGILQASKGLTTPEVDDLFREWAAI